ncbi:MAG: SDR family NAD(P)-dependent oxidoreductase, partial [Rhizobiales bacterium]|nr:SDR family NAD(P)-dependent oxidoreductase [Hyphomicrobiales bacterium]
MDLDLDGRVVAGGGIGRAIALLLASLRARVFVADRSREGLATLSAAYPDICTWEVDLVDRAAAARWIVDVEQAAQTPIAVLVNNAGGSLGQVPRDLTEISHADWDSIVDINLNAAFALSGAMVPGM